MQRSFPFPNAFQTRFVPGVSLLSLIVISIITCEANADAQNFVSPDPLITQAAEAARHRSAMYWSGTPLPGNWSTPCPILIVPALHSGGGQTHFRFEGGEVSGWRMSVSGRREELIRNVIPHEVDHMVRASLVRRRIERWLDEGCALLMESPEVHQQLRSVARSTSAEVISPDWLSAIEYPQSSAANGQLDAVGFSLVEFLLTRESPAVLLAVQRETDSVEARLQRHYGLTIPALREEWSRWKGSAAHVTCREGWCPMHHPGTAGSLKRPVLTIWTADWCPPCRQFKADFSTSAEFQATLQSAFQIEWRDYDQHNAEAVRNGIRSVPTFVVNRGMPHQFNGYAGPAELLERLGLPPIPATQMLPTREPTLTPIPEPSTPETNEAPIVPLIPTPPAERGLSWLPITWTVLQWTGIIAGCAATGGVSGFALTLLSLAWKRQRRKRSQRSAGPQSGHPRERRDEAIYAPFPRELDEARELLELRQSEGRVATLDTLRGMFFDDEVEKLSQSEPASAPLLEKLRNAIDSRVDEVAPLTT